MIEIPYFRHQENKCPICGTFELSNDEEKTCATCDTKFNNFMILEIGKKMIFDNN